jgi:hypothetical protein
MKNKWLSLPEYVKDLLGAFAVAFLCGLLIPWPWACVIGFAFLSVMQFVHCQLVLAQLEARRTRAGAERLPISDGVGDGFWYCLSNMPTCSWTVPLGHRRPVHTRKQHERLLKEAGK